MNLIVCKNNSVRIKKRDISQLFVTCSYEPVVIFGRDRKEGGSCRGDYRCISRLNAAKIFRGSACMEARLVQILDNSVAKWASPKTSEVHS